LELLGGIASRDSGAFVAFYRRYLSTVLAFLVRQTGDGELAADLAAEVFAAVMIAAVRYKPLHETARPWLLAIARNVLGTSRREGRVIEQARQQLGFQPLDLDDADLERARGLADEGRGELDLLLASLPEHEREALRLRVVEERDYAEIATELACSEMVVRKRVSRGLGRLRTRLEEQGR
jgi:RNA polymerase sigma-70 factor (ECF subfamily)